jgi:hypothetical protein
MPEMRVKVGAVLMVQPWDGYRVVGQLADEVVQRLPISLATRDVEVTYERNLHILTQRDNEDVPYVAAHVYDSLPSTLAHPGYYGVQGSTKDRVDFAVCAYNAKIDRYILVALKGIAAARSGRSKDEILFNTGWVGGENGLADWIATRNLLKL